MKLIDTPYGRKTPELLCAAMDAHSLLPELLAALEYIEGRLPAGDTKSIAQARAAIAKAKGLKP